MKIRISLAEIPIEINTENDAFLYFFRNYITDEEPLFSVSATKDEVDCEKEYHKNEKSEKAIAGCSDYEFEKTAIYRKIAEKIVDYDGVVFHGSAVAVGEKAYIFTAKSGTGKTTHTRLWLKNIENSYVINGDKPILRIIDGKPYVCGTPWMGKENFGCNKKALIKSICLLKRGGENETLPISFSEAFPKLVNQTYRPSSSKDVIKTVKILEKLSKSVGFYSLTCNMENDAALTAYEAII